jgi:hypothetical protein
VRWTVETPLIAVHDSGKPLVAEVILLFLMVFYFTVWLLGFCGFLASWPLLACVLFGFCFFLMISWFLGSMLQLSCRQQVKHKLERITGQ